jgi:hypothetical protein
MILPSDFWRGFLLGAGLVLGALIVVYLIKRARAAGRPE